MQEITQLIICKISDYVVKKLKDSFIFRMTVLYFNDYRTGKETDACSGNVGVLRFGKRGDCVHIKHFTISDRNRRKFLWNIFAGEVLQFYSNRCIINLLF